MNIRNGIDHLKAMAGIRSDAEALKKAKLWPSFLSMISVNRSRASLKSLTRLATSCEMNLDDLLILSLELDKVHPEVLAYHTAKAIEYLHNRKVLEP